MIDPREFKYLTVCFEVDARTIPGNPLLIESPFGKPVTVGLGDMFERCDQLEEELERMGAR